VCHLGTVQRAWDPIAAGWIARAEGVRCETRQLGDDSNGASAIHSRVLFASCASSCVQRAYKRKTRCADQRHPQRNPHSRTAPHPPLPPSSSCSPAPSLLSVCSPERLLRETLLVVIPWHAADLSSSTSVTVLNNCTYQVDPAFYPAVTRSGATTGGFKLASKASSVVTLADGYSGRIWGRTGCNSTGICTTGQCPGGESCTGPSTTGPTLAQFTIDGYASTDYFNPSTADGFNLVVTITPGKGCTCPLVQSVQIQLTHFVCRLDCGCSLWQGWYWPWVRSDQHLPHRHQLHCFVLLSGCAIGLRTNIELSYCILLTNTYDYMK
jgi:hypothetical protein